MNPAPLSNAAEQFIAWREDGVPEHPMLDYFADIFGAALAATERPDAVPSPKMSPREKAYDAVDACVFSSDMLHQPEERAVFSGYLARWNTAFGETASTPEAYRAELHTADCIDEGCPACVTCGQPQSSAMEPSERKTFEAWMQRTNGPLRDHDLKWYPSDGSYDNTHVNIAWNGWQARAVLALAAPPGDWQQYAKEGETAQQCIERHRKEHDDLLTLLAQARTAISAAHEAVLRERKFHFAHNPPNTGLAAGFNTILKALAAPASEPVIKYVPINTKEYRRHPNDKEPTNAACEQALDDRGDSDDQGLDPFWKWAFRQGFRAALAAAKAEPEAEAVQAEPSDFDIDAVRNQLTPSVWALQAFERILAAKRLPAAQSDAPAVHTKPYGWVVGGEVLYFDEGTALQDAYARRMPGQELPIVPIYTAPVQAKTDCPNCPQNNKCCVPPADPAVQTSVPPEMEDYSRWADKQMPAAQSADAVDKSYTLEEIATACMLAEVPGGQYEAIEIALSAEQGSEAERKSAAGEKKDPWRPGDPAEFTA